MREIKVYNTHAREKQVFEPLDAQNVRMYVCGPTVYNYAHIGNARPVVVFDMLFRLLRHVYGEDSVTYARNFTDVDDKIMDAADEQGVSIKSITTKYTKAYIENMGALNALEPSISPKATEHIPDMIKMVRELVEKGFAYEAEGHVVFHVAAMDEYGRLSRHSRDELIAGARVEVAPYKKDPADFVLWKPSSEDQVGWGSPWGRGRPGWHLECSAMIKKHLGDTIDIHGGGQDLIFPHHENEIAQSECCHGERFVRYWMHNGYLTVDGEKMSKSLGNFHTVQDLLQDHEGEALRLALLTAHYRQPIDFSLESLAEQKRRLDRWYRLTDGVEATTEVPEEVLAALADDINTPMAIAALDALAAEETAAELKAGAQFMGLLLQSVTDWFQAFSPEQEAWIEANSNAYSEARANKDFDAADKLRAEATELGLAIEVSSDGITFRLLN